MSKDIDESATQLCSQDNNIDKGDTVLLENRHVTPIKVIGEYELLEKIGEGGMAEVYKARHRGLDTIRAVKLLAPKYADDKEFIARFKREAQIAARLQHNNIVVIHHVGTKGKYNYIDMEYIDGVNLNKIRNSQKRIPMPVAVLIIAEVCKALSHAHRREFIWNNEKHRSIVHRDVKPGNIMITREGEVKLTDFGIARAVEVSDVTIAGTLVGTVPYMSKEQIDGKHIDHRTDIYSLGVVLYEILTGKKPFGEEPVGKVLKNISSGKCQPVRKAVPDIPKEIERIVMKAMALEPENRYQDALDMYNDIYGYINSVYDKLNTGREIQRYLRDKDNYTPPDMKKSPVRIQHIVATGAGITVIAGMLMYLGYLVYGMICPPKHTIIVSADVAGFEVVVDDMEFQTSSSYIEIGDISPGKHKVTIRPYTLDKKPVTQTIDVDDVFEIVEVKFEE